MKRTLHCVSWGDIEFEIEPVVGVASRSPYLRIEQDGEAICVPISLFSDFLRIVTEMLE